MDNNQCHSRAFREKRQVSVAELLHAVDILSEDPNSSLLLHALLKSHKKTSFLTTKVRQLEKEVRFKDEKIENLKAELYSKDREIQDLNDKVEEYECLVNPYNSDQTLGDYYHHYMVED